MITFLLTVIAIEFAFMCCFIPSIQYHIVLGAKSLRWIALMINKENKCQ